MRYRFVLLGIAFLCGACASTLEALLVENDPTESMGSPETTGFAVIVCDPDGLENHVGRCTIVRKGHEQQSIRTPRRRWGCFYFPGLEPGRYCIRLIEGHKYLPKKDVDGNPALIDPIPTEDYHYSFSPWSVRGVIFEVKCGVPVYFGRIMVGARKGGVTVKHMGKSEGVWIENSPKYEKKTWERFLKKFPESVWAEAVRERLAELQEM
jgi:hypothetical protein